MNVHEIARRATGVVVSIVVGWSVVGPSPVMVSATELEPGFVTSIPSPTGVTISGAWAANPSRGEAYGWGVDSAGYSVATRFVPSTGDITTVRSTTVGDVTARLVHSHNSTSTSYVVTQRSTPGDRIIAVDQATLVRGAAYTLGSTESSVTTFTTGSAGNVGYVTTGSNPTKVFRLATPAMTLLSSATLPTGIGLVSASTVYGGYLWLFTGSNPVKLVAVNPSTLAVVSTTSLDGVAAGLTSLTMAGSVAYLGSESGTGRVVAVDLATTSVVGTAVLGAGETGARVGVFDSTTGMLTVASTTTSGTRLLTIDSATLQVVGRSLADGTGTPISVFGFGRHIFVGSASGPAAVQKFTRAPAPDAPTDLAVVSADGALRVSWAAASSIEDVTEYEVIAESSAGSSSCLSDDVTCTVQGLSNGTSYRVSVRARSIAGWGQTVQAWGVPFTVPAAPGGVSAERGDRFITVRWAAPADGGSAITGYRAVARVNEQRVAECVSAESSCTLTELVNGVSHTVSVFAVNAAGESIGATVPSVAPATTPEPPTVTAVLRGNHQLSVHWAGPDVDGGDPITGFEAVAYLDDVVAVAQCEAGSTSAACDLTGLVNGLSYRVSVRARNSVGVSEPGFALGVYVPATVPDAPGDVVAVRGDRSILVRWLPPTETGGLPVQEFRVVAVAPDGAEHDCRTSGNECRVVDLTNGSLYQVRVTARNEVGESAEARSVNSALPATVPGQPAAVSVTVGNQSVEVTWRAPEDTGGEEIQTYRAFAIASDGRLVGICDSTTLSCRIDALTNGDPVTVTVVARNTVGDSTESEATNPTAPATVPTAPTITVVERGNSIITAVWAAPIDDGGAVIMSYTATATAAGLTQTSCTTTDNRCVLTGLVNGAAYRVQVTAANAMGVGAASNLSTGLVPAGPPSAPRSLAISTKTSNQVALRWKAPARSNGEPVVDYTVQWSTRKTTGFVSLRDPRSTVTTTSFTRPRKGVTLYVRVMAVNGAGVSVATKPIAVPAK